LPACDAVNVHVPTVTIVMLKPLTVQMLVSDDARDTVSSEVELGDTANDDADHARSVGSANVTVCAALSTEISCDAEASDPDEYVIVNVPGVPVMPSPLNVATPATATELPVPTTVPEDKVAVTVSVAVVTLLPPASRISTTGWVVKAFP